ncbi:hypothetical protein [Phenylobacterium immobile]|uniref:hypothetical protein n=1 Tax=Phenylobacterium immobile TaxID=21 RepID=UPI000A58E6D4|nr:hypothetical protein [Phenylobacterium immobile]
MRKLLIAAGVAGGLGLAFSLAGCEEKKAEVAAAPAPKKSISRMDQMYAGEEQIVSVESGTAERNADKSIMLTAKGMAASAGYTRPYFLPRIYIAPPPGGVYEVDVVASKPAEAAAQVLTPITVEGNWAKYNDDRVQGVTFITKTNQVTVMVTPAK